MTAKLKTGEVNLDTTGLVEKIIQSTTLQEAIRKAITDTLQKEMKIILEPYEERMKSLQTQLDDMEKEAEKYRDEVEQYSRRNNLRFFGIPEVETEDTDRIIKTIALEKLGLNLPEWAICRSHRVGQKNKEKPRPIIVKFVSYNIRKQVFTEKKKLKNSKITIKEDLTKQRLKLYNDTFQVVGMKNVWSYDGKIMIWDTLAKKKRVITSNEDLDQYRTARQENTKTSNETGALTTSNATAGITTRSVSRHKK